MTSGGASRQRLLELLRRHGWNATSFQAMERGFRYWFDAEADAAVAYLDTRRARVVAGAPVAAGERWREVARRFIADAERQGKRVVFFATERTFLQRVPMRSLAAGEQPAWDPRAWVERHRGHRGLKEQLRRARAKGVSVSRVASQDVVGSMRVELGQLITRWLSTRVMPPMSFVVALEPFAFAEERRYYVARATGRFVGLLVAVPVYDRGGWFFENILRDPAAPNGTTELMIDTAMRDVAADGCEYVTLGLAPLAGDERWQRLTRRLLGGFYNFDGLRAFKAKLRPDVWTPIFIAWPDDVAAPLVVLDVLRAFAGGSVIAFGLRAAVRAPRPVLFTLGALLVVWTLALASSDTKRWFASRREQAGWVAFDALMAAALFSLAKTWRRPLAATASIAALCDGLVTTASVIRRRQLRKRDWRDRIVIAAAVVAPFAAAAILLGGLQARRPRTAIARQ